MPKISLATWENRVREYDPNSELPRGAVKKLAKTISRRHAAFIHEPTEQEVLELFRTIVYGDPVGDEAARHLDNPASCTHNDNAARRLSLVAAS